MSETVRRRVFFYDVQAQSKKLGEMLDPAPILGRINSIPFPRRYMVEPDRNKIFMQVYASTPTAVSGIIAKTRVNDLPDLEKMGKTEELDLEPGQGLVDITHWIYFKKSQIIGVESFFYGPRASKIDEYVNFLVCEPGEEVGLVFRLNQAALEQVSNFREVKVINLKASKDQLAHLKEADQSLAKALSDTLAISGAESIEVVLKGPPRAHFAKPKFVSNLVKWLRREPDADVGSASVAGRGLTGKDVAIDLIEDHLEGEVIAFRASSRRSRSADSESMFQGISGLYQKYRNYFEGNLDEQRELVR